MTSTLTDKKVLVVGRGSGIAYSIEVLVLPVSDVDQARDFYTEKAGFTLDVDYQPTDDFRVVQLTPPGSACSIQIGMGLTDATPGSIPTGPTTPASPTSPIPTATSGCCRNAASATSPEARAPSAASPSAPRR
jgi:catechol 2,3-dioxygenase-like lactoylglutathione lyase family enzyme